MLQLTYKIIVLFLILHSSVGFSQITAEIRGTDTVYVVSRNFLEFAASRFDSLEQTKKYFSRCKEMLTDAEVTLNSCNKLNLQKDTKILSLQNEIKLNSDLIESYKRSEIIAKETERRLKQQIRKKKVWQVVAVAAISGFATTSVLLWLRQ